jgi:hypothetical protein
MQLYSFNFVRECVVAGSFRCVFLFVVNFQLPKLLLYLEVTNWLRLYYRLYLLDVFIVLFSLVTGRFGLRWKECWLGWLFSLLRQLYCFGEQAEVDHVDYFLWNTVEGIKIQDFEHLFNESYIALKRGVRFISNLLIFDYNPVVFIGLCQNDMNLLGLRVLLLKYGVDFDF